MPAQKRTFRGAATPAKKRAARVITRTGDRGSTSLFGPGRVRKTDPRIAALGDLDEAQAAIGVARARLRAADAAALLECQRGLYLVMAEVATPRATRPTRRIGAEVATRRPARLARRIEPDDVAALDALGEWLRARAGAEPRFVVPGENARSAALDHARTVARRAERAVVGLADARVVDATFLLPWLNRLSDVLYLMARASEPQAVPAKTRASEPQAVPATARAREPRSAAATAMPAKARPARKV